MQRGFPASTQGNPHCSQAREGDGIGSSIGHGAGPAGIRAWGPRSQVRDQLTYCELYLDNTVPKACQRWPRAELPSCPCLPPKALALCWMDQAKPASANNDGPSDGTAGEAPGGGEVLGNQVLVPVPAFTGEALLLSIMSSSGFHVSVHVKQGACTR